jgi:hypothetical protein
MSIANFNLIKRVYEPKCNCSFRSATQTFYNGCRQAYLTWFSHAIQHRSLMNG